MSTPSHAVEREVQTYAGGEDRPLGAFVGLMGVYGAAVTGLGIAVKRSGVPLQVPVSDLALLSLATAKVAKLLSHDRVTSPLRAPFTRFENFGSAGEVEESPRGTGVRLAVGELATCPYCLAQWVGTGLLGAMLLRPTETRLVAGLFTMLLVNDALQVGHSHLLSQA